MADSLPTSWPWLDHLSAARRQMPGKFAPGANDGQSAEDPASMRRGCRRRGRLGGRGRRRRLRRGLDLGPRHRADDAVLGDAALLLEGLDGLGRLGAEPNRRWRPCIRAPPAPSGSASHLGRCRRCARCHSACSPPDSPPWSSPGRSSWWHRRWSRSVRVRMTRSVPRSGRPRPVLATWSIPRPSRSWPDASAVELVVVASFVPLVQAARPITATPTRTSELFGSYHGKTVSPRRAGT